MKKIIGIFVCMLLIIAALPIVGSLSVEKTQVWVTTGSGPDLYCEGEIVRKVEKSGSTITDSFTVENKGEPSSLLEWMVTSWPEFGTNWTFHPTGGIDLKPADGKITVTVTFTAPIVEKNVYFGGVITISAVNNPSDFEVIAVNINVANKSLHRILEIPPITVLAGDEENPEITDVIGDARTYLDIKKAWFYENPSTPDVLYTTIEIVKPSTIPSKQHLVVLWEMNGEHYASMLAVGYDIGIEFPWLYYSAIQGRGQFGDPKPITSTIDGFFNTTDGTVTCKIPKSTIGNPQPGDVLTNTQSQCFQRFGFWGRLGFYPPFRYMLFNQILGKWKLEDTAPDPLNNEFVYGRDYVIQY